MTRSINANHNGIPPKICQITGADPDRCNRSGCTGQISSPEKRIIEKRFLYSCYIWTQNHITIEMCITG